MCHICNAPRGSNGLLDNLCAVRFKRGYTFWARLVGGLYFRAMGKPPNQQCNTRSYDGCDYWSVHNLCAHISLAQQNLLSELQIRVLRWDDFRHWSDFREGGGFVNGKWAGWDAVTPVGSDDFPMPSRLYEEMQ